MAKKSKVKGVAAALKKAKGQAPAKKRAPRKAAPKSKTPTTGQSAAPIELSVAGLNAKESKVLGALNGSGAGLRAVLTITELATACFKSQSKKKSNSWTRNSLRRLVQAGLVEKVERGKYRVSAAGRKKLAKAA
jgi:hypothetical protein